MPANTTIELEERTNYGHKAFYIVSEHAAPVLALTHRRTLSRPDIESLKTLGFTIKVRGQAEKVL